MNKKLFSLIYLLSFTLLAAVAQNNSEYSIEVELDHLPVIGQGNTGTCWSFATTSFLESEILRKGFPETDLSEMFFVYHAYQNKAEKYLLYHGNNNFSQGGQAHDVMDVLEAEGMVLQEAYEGKKVNGRYVHRQLIQKLEKEIQSLNEAGKVADISKTRSYSSILKEYIGKIPKKFHSDNQKFTPSAFRDHFELDADDYIEITSYTHHPFYEPFVLEVPDNWSNDLYYNVPLEEMMEILFHSLNNGYTVCWDGDTSEKKFQHRKGSADVDKKYTGKVNQKLRQETFNDRTTTDDHLMHIVGISKNPEGKTCFYTKNSWGADSNDFGGYLHMTEDYVRLKTIALLVHKDAIPENIRQKLNL
ncbi:MAG: C1 family peptidase [Prolixibacteraceae bacterium]